MTAIIQTPTTFAHRAAATATQTASVAKKPRTKAGPVARTSADAASFRRLTTTINRVVMVAAFAISFTSQMAVGTWLGLGWFSFLVPLALDALLFNISLAIPTLRAMGENTRLFNGALLFVTCLVSALNVAHIVLPSISQGLSYEGVAAAIVAGLIPFVILLTTHLELTLNVAKTTGSTKTLAARQAAIDSGADITNSPAPKTTTTVKKTSAASPVPSRLSDDQRSEIVRLDATGMTIPKIAAEVGTSAPTTRKFLRDSGLYPRKEN